MKSRKLQNEQQQFPISKGRNDILQPFKNETVEGKERGVPNMDLARLISEKASIVNLNMPTETQKITGRTKLH